MNNQITTLLRKQALAGVMATCAIAALSHPAYAQFEEILVTARKKEETLQAVPIAVTAFSGEDFQNAGLAEFGQIARLTPNFVVLPGGAAGSAFASLVIRGQTSGFLTLNADQAVGLYINGAPITRGTNIFSNLFDVERIEVLKGPQGTLYGKNTTGGAVNVITKAPVLGEVEGYGQVDVGNFGRFNYEGVINAPLGEKAALRFGAARTSRNGFGTGALTGQELADDDEFFLRAGLLFVPNEDLTIRINADYHEVDERGTIFRSNKDALGGFLAFESTNPDFYVGNDAPGTQNTTTADEFNINATINYDLGWGVLDSITSYRSQELLTEYQTAPVTPVILGQDATLFAQELRLSGEAMGGKLDWQTGLFYATESGEDIDFLVNFGQFEVTAAQNKSYAAFANLAYDLTEVLAVRAGLRYTYEEREVRDLEAGAPILFAEADFDGIQWTVGIDYTPVDGVLTYLTASEGFRSGAIDQGNLGVIVDPENVLTFEAGLKSEFFDNRVRFNAAVFYSDYTNIQRSLFDPSLVGEISTVFQNAGDATLMGFEAELYATPIDNLNFGFTLGYTDAAYDVFNAFDGNGDPLDRSNDEFGLPEWQASAFARYEYPISADSTVGAQLNYFWQSDIDYTSIDTAAVVAAQNLDPDLLRVQSYGILNGQLDYKFDWHGETSISLYATNILEKEFAVAGFVGVVLGDLVSNRVIGEPRTFGARLRKSF